MEVRGASVCILAHEGTRVQDQVALLLPRQVPIELGEAQVVAYGQANSNALARKVRRSRPTSETVANLRAFAHVAQVHLVVRANNLATRVDDRLTDGNAASRCATQQSVAHVRIGPSRDAFEKVRGASVVGVLCVCVRISEDNIIIRCCRELRQDVQLMARIGTDHCLRTPAIFVDVARRRRNLQPEDAQRRHHRRDSSDAYKQ